MSKFDVHLLCASLKSLRSRNISLACWDADEYHSSSIPGNVKLLQLMSSSCFHKSPVLIPTSAELPKDWLEHCYLGMMTHASSHLVGRVELYIIFIFTGL